MSYTEQTLAAQQKMQDADIWFTFLVDSKYRRFNCEANKHIIDEYLTRNGFELSLTTLATAVAALGRKLVEIEPSEQLRRKAAQAHQPSQPAPAQPSNEIPADITRQKILRMGRDEYKLLVNNFGTAAIMQRVNYGI